MDARARAHEHEVHRLAWEGAQQRSLLQARIAELQVWRCQSLCRIIYAVARCNDCDPSTRITAGVVIAELRFR